MAPKFIFPVQPLLEVFRIAYPTDYLEFPLGCLTDASIVQSQLLIPLPTFYWWLFQSTPPLPVTSLYIHIVHATNLRSSLDLRGPTSSLWTLSPKHTSFLSTTASNQVQIISILHWYSYNDLLIDLPLSAPILSTHGGVQAFKCTSNYAITVLTHFLWGIKLHLW